MSAQLAPVLNLPRMGVVATPAASPAITSTWQLRATEDGTFVAAPKLPGSQPVAPPPVPATAVSTVGAAASGVASMGATMGVSIMDVPVLEGLERALAALRSAVARVAVHVPAAWIKGGMSAARQGAMSVVGSVRKAYAPAIAAVALLLVCLAFSKVLMSAAAVGVAAYMALRWSVLR